MKKLIFFFLFITFICSMTFAQKKVVAVVETQIDEASGAAKMISKAEVFGVDNGMLVASSPAVRTGKIVELLEKGSAACAAMYKSFLEATSPKADRQTAVTTSTPPPAATPALIPTPTPAPAPAPASSRASSDRGSFTDPRDKKTYRTATIGGKTWMAENLNYRTGKSWCYGDNNAYCDKYGRLYDWNTAMKACPAGWHLPSDDEWTALVNAVESANSCGDCAAKHLKASSGWNNCGPSGSSYSCMDTHGFSALPGGLRWDGGFLSAGNYGSWWSAAEDVAGNAWNRYMLYLNEDVYRGSGGNKYGFSVRCVRDD